MKASASVDDYIAAAKYWQQELKLLREILRSTELTETVKWGGPCYTYDGQNVVGMGSFKSYFGLWFFQGALLQDKEHILINAQVGKTKALRQWRMTSSGDIKRALIKRYLNEAIKLARDGRKISANRSKAIVIPPELKLALQKNKAADSSFRNLAPGLQREYAEYVADAKREETKRRRLEKILPMKSVRGF